MINAPHQPLPRHQMNEIANLVSAHIREIQAHQFEEGIYEVRCRSTALPLAHHHAVALVGKPARDFNPYYNGPIILHKTDLGVSWKPFNPLEWERLHKVPDWDIPTALHRARISWGETWAALDNCEHWSTYVTKGVKESSQVQSFVKFGIGATIAYFLLRDDQ